MEKNVYVVSFEAENGYYGDITAVFSTMEKAKQYVESTIDRMSGLYFNTTYANSDNYRAEFINTHSIYIDGKPYATADKVYVTIIEYKVDCEE